jgi:hypothetical protein
MERTAAERLMRIYAGIGNLLNEATEVVGTLPDQDEQKLHRRAIGTMMGDLWLGLQLPIVREHHDLDPDKKA